MNIVEFLFPIKKSAYGKFLEAFKGLPYNEQQIILNAILHREEEAKRDNMGDWAYFLNKLFLDLYRGEEKA